MNRRHYSFTSHSREPFLSPAKGTFFSESATTADVLEFGAEVLLFFGGLSDHERIGLAVAPRRSFDGRTWTNWLPEPVLDAGPPGSFDCRHVTDPASICTESAVLLYYSGLGEADDGIGLATSKDGRTFRKHPANPILQGRAPEIVYHQGLFHLYFVRPNRHGGYSIFMADSSDGMRFSMPFERPVLEPSAGRWDSYTVTTPRILQGVDRFWLAYAGDDQTRDSPKGFGLAFSEDLIHWEKYRGNPVFSRGPAGSWDDHAIWFPTLYSHQNQVYMLYEGSRKPSDSSEPISQVGLAALEL